MHPPLRKMWMFKGQQVTIPAPGANKKLHLFGALLRHQSCGLPSVYHQDPNGDFLV